MDVTVVMITRDRCESTIRTVHMLADLPEQPPVVVVDNGSSDKTVEALCDVPAVTVIAAGRNLGSAGRTLGVRAARTSYVAFADDDSWWAPGALAEAARLFEDAPRLGLLTGRTLIGPDQREDPINRLLAAAPFGTDPDLPGPTALGFLACAAVVRRSAYLQVGGFHRRFGVGGEEQLLAIDLLRSGWGACYAPQLVAHHHPATDTARAARPIRQRRNDVWTTWLRRRPAAVAATTAALLRQAVSDPTARAVLAGAVRGLPWIAVERRAVPVAMDRMLARLAAPADSP